MSSIPPSHLCSQVPPATGTDELAVILEGLDEGFYAVDRTWRLKRFNGLASRHFGRPPNEVIGRRLWDLFPAAAVTPLGRQFFRAMETKQLMTDQAASVVVKGKVLAYRLFSLPDGLGVAWRDVTVTNSPIQDPAFDVFGFGVAELFPDGRLAKANDPAFEVFRRRDGFRLDGRVRAVVRASDIQFQKMITQAAKEANRGQRYCGHVSIPRNSEARSYIAHVSSMAILDAARPVPSVLLTISDADRKLSVDHGELVRLFGLTASEARLVGLLADGVPLPVIAKKLNIAFTTARTHLARARAKTQTASQIDLVRLVLKSFPT